MNKTFYILFFVFASVFCNAQTNLIYNADFEIYDNCPLGISTPGDYQIEHCLGWRAATYATSDYFNICNAGLVGVPNNLMGYQVPRSGNGYCGLIAYSYSNGGCYSGNYWFEYIQGKFINPLVAGHVYQIGFYVSLANYSTVAISQLGFYISDTAIGNTCSPVPLSYIPQITNPLGTFLTDTAGWTLIAGNYTATGGEQYITIGNFADTLTTDTISVFSHNDPFSYYYIDSASFYDITDELMDQPTANVFSPNNDGINDLFFISGLQEGDKYEIFNRWGEKIYEGSYNIGWDGRTTKGVMCSDGVYYYITETENKNKQAKKGFIQLLR